MIRDKLNKELKKMESGEPKPQKEESTPKEKEQPVPTSTTDADENNIILREEIIQLRKESSKKVVLEKQKSMKDKMRSQSQDRMSGWDSDEDNNVISEEKSPIPVIPTNNTGKYNKQPRQFMFSSPQSGPLLPESTGLKFKLDYIKQGGGDAIARNFPLARGKPLVIGVCGGNCSGKMDVVKMLIQRLGKKNCTTVKQENFYKNLPENESFKEFNYDDPNATDWKHMQDALDALLVSRKPFKTPIYDFKLHKRGVRTEELWPNPIIIVEGLLILHFEGIRKRCDLKLFLDTDDDVRLSRRILKDVARLGRNVNDVVDRYRKFVKPCHDRYVLPSRKYADMILPSFGKSVCEEIDDMQVLPSPKKIGSNDIQQSHYGTTKNINIALELMIEQVKNELEIQQEIRLFKKQLI